jgi:hypothetical protein
MTHLQRGLQNLYPTFFGLGFFICLHSDMVILQKHFIPSEKRSPFIARPAGGLRAKST